MNKKLVAVAIAGLLAAPLAQAQTANVTLYGRVNIDMEFVNGRLSNNTNPNVYRVTSNSSRFGLRGTESLGGGLNAIFQVENGSIRPTTGDGGNLAGRDSFVGLSGGWACGRSRKRRAARSRKYLASASSRRRRWWR